MPIASQIRKIASLLSASAVAAFSLPAAADTGLIFPKNSASGGPVYTDVYAFQWQDTTGLPFYGPGDAGVTILFEYTPTDPEQAGYYTSFFFASRDPGTPNSGAMGCFEGTWNGSACSGSSVRAYYGAHPYPIMPPNSTDHYWEISTEQTDDVNADDGSPVTVIAGQTYVQAFVVTNPGAGNSKTMKFFVDLPNVTTGDIITRNTASTYGDTPPTNPMLFFADAPWSFQYGRSERLAGRLRGLKIFAAALSQSDMLIEASRLDIDGAITTAGIDSIWYSNVNPTPTDISDKSGNANDPTWVNESFKPTLWESVEVGPTLSGIFFTGASFP